MRRLSVRVLVAVVLTSACAGNGTRTRAAGTSTTSSTVAAGVPTTTTSTTSAAAPTTTTAAAPKALLVPATAPPVTAPQAPLPAVATTRTGVVVPVVGRATTGAGFTVTSPCGREATVATITPLTGVAVVLDAGHGGRESGAVGPNGLTENKLNMAVSNHAKNALEAAGVKVGLTRTSEYMMSLSTRGKVVMALQPKAFVSIHHNAEPDGVHEGPGSETYYQIGNADSKRLAGLVYEEVHQALSQYQLPWVADLDAGAKYRPGKSGDYYAVLRLTKGVNAVLSEGAFISNPPEEELLARPDVQKVEGEAIARAILRFLTTPDPGSGFVEPYPRTEPAGGGGGSGGSCVDPPLE